MYVSVRKSSIQVLSVSPSCLVWCSHIPNHWHPFDFHTGLCLYVFFFLWLFKRMGCLFFFLILVWFLSLCSFDFILNGLRKLFNMKLTTKRSKHNQSPKNDQWLSHAMVTLVVPFKVKCCLWNTPATFLWVLKIYSHFLRDPFETKGGCFPIKQEWALSTI